MTDRRQQGVQALKRWQRRLYSADYHEAEPSAGPGGPDPAAPFTERVLAVRPNPQDIGSVLIFKPDEIGDAVYALPAVAELRRRFPHASVYLICQRLTEAVYTRSGLFDEIATVTPDVKLGRPRIAVDDALAQLSVRDFDMSIYLRTYAAAFRDFRRVPARIKVHPVDPLMRSDSVHRVRISLNGPNRRHQALMLLEIVGRVTGRSYRFADVAFPEFQWTDEDRRAPKLAFDGPVPPRFVVVHPFAKHETRAYPRAYWHELLRRLVSTLGATLVVVGGPGDPRLDEIDGVVQTQGRLGLGQSGYLTSQAHGFIGVLSGPAHWAAAMGTPTVTLMSGHSLPVEWAPLGRSLVLRADVPCAPCHQPECPIYGLACLTEMTPERVAPDIERFLEPVLTGD